MTSVAIESINLTKKYGEFTALNNLNLSINKGEIFGLLGPNGAGKSTFMNIIATLLSPTSGEVSIYGHNVKKEKQYIRKIIALVPQDLAIDFLLTVEDNLYFYASLHGVSRRELKKRIEQVSKEFGLESKLRDAVLTLSGGQCRRLMLARVFLAKKKLLILDEPTLGIDVEGKQYIWKSLKSLVKDSNNEITVLVATNDMKEAEELCDRIAFIKEGHIIALDTPHLLKAIVGSTTIKVTIDNSTLSNDWYRHIPEAKDISLEGDAVTFFIEKTDESLLKALNYIKDYTFIKQVSIREPALEDVFLRFIAN
ncbi:ABC transporter ATP-binding protein [bacterium]|nr:ABC transporter ATP-binding protein [bacterium]